MVFGVPEGTEVKVSDRQKAERLGYKGDFTRLGNSCWFTSMEHGRRHESLTLNSLARNKKVIRSKKDNTYSYQKYDNYDAIEIPNTKLIPSDYDGVMGVPISFLDKYCPEQFDLIGMGEDNGMGYSGGVWLGGSKSCLINGRAAFKRIFIRHKNPQK